MAQFSNLKLLFTLKFNGGQFYKEISNFGSFKKLRQVKTRKNKPK